MAGRLDTPRPGVKYEIATKVIEFADPFADDFPCRIVVGAADRRAR